MSVALAQNIQSHDAALETFEDGKNHIIDIDDDIHDAIDRVIAYYQKQDIEPRFTFSGTPLDIAANLAQEVKASLPNEYADDMQVVLNYMIQQFVDYCREAKSNNLTVTFAFKRGKQNKQESET